jgi:hypothetical protein
MTTCKQCSQAFEITDEDLAFYDKVSPVFNGKKELITPPTQCHHCRLQRRMACVNQLSLYERTCDLTGSSIISNIRPGSPYKVYRQQDWHGDAWDALEYGKDFDFKRPFFDQWNELCLAVPRPSLFTGYEFDENAAYTNHSGKNKDCYLIFDSDENRDCYYSYSINSCVNCLDCFRVRKSELCYQCVDCVQCYGSSYLQDCDNCTQSMFLKNCTGCKNCLMCSNLKNKEYHVENKQVTKEEFEKYKSMLNSTGTITSSHARFDALKLEHPQKYMHGMQNENVVGDYLVNCKDAYMCFDSEDLWDCRYVFQGFMPLKSCMDIQECGDGELLYECSVMGYNVHSSAFCSHVLASISDMYYCSLCPHSKNCFGCIGLQRKQYCVFNKQYTKEEYETLVPKIIAHMRSTNEWSEFFPITISTYAYNESLAQDYYPMTKEEVLAKGWAWLDESDKQGQYLGPQIAVPETIEEVDDDICKKILTCEASGKQYKIIPQELKFYRQMQLPIPRESFFVRHKNRMKLRNPRKLWQRSCAKCLKDIQTTYRPDRPEIIYCERCYLETVY